MINFVLASVATYRYVVGESYSAENEPHEELRMLPEDDLMIETCVSVLT